MQPMHETTSNEPATPSFNMHAMQEEASTDTNQIATLILGTGQPHPVSHAQATCNVTTTQLTAPVIS